MSTFLVDRFEDYSTVVGDNKAIKPNMVAFNNSKDAIEMLHRHINGDQAILVHTDIDMDGIGCAYILHRELLSLGALNRTGFVINKEKEHGIQQRHVDYIKKVPIGLLIVLDSSTNELEYIKQMECDVIVVDHHEILHSELKGKTAKGDYIIVSNMIDNLDVDGTSNWIKEISTNTDEIIDIFKKDKRMSGGLVLYELLRLYQVAHNTGNILEKMQLYQWVGITLFTDVISLANARNQFYIEQTVHTMEIEKGLQVLLKSITRFQSHIDKYFIEYKLAPTVNKAIRAGGASSALDIILNRQEHISELDQYKQSQINATDNFMDGVAQRENCALKNITNTNIHRNYSGLLASKICSETNKNSVVFVVKDGIAMGSFRGRYRGVDYRKEFEAFEPGIYAQGHEPAFGFKVREEILVPILEKLSEIENVYDKRPYVTAGNNIPAEEKGKYHIQDINNFKQQGLLWKLAMANSRVSSDEAVEIITSINEVKLIEQKGALCWYDVLGLKCMAFEFITSKYVSVYIEYSKEIKCYVRNVNK